MIRTKTTVDNSVLNILDGDLILSMKAATNGHILTHGVRVYVKGRDGWQQVGLIKELCFSAVADKVLPHLEVSFEDHPRLSSPLKKAIASNIKKLAKLGILVKKPKK
jgi:hypothetical protein